MRKFGIMNFSLCDNLLCRIIQSDGTGNDVFTRKGSRFFFYNVTPEIQAQRVYLLYTFYTTLNIQTVKDIIALACIGFHDRLYIGHRSLHIRERRETTRSFRNFAQRIFILSIFIFTYAIFASTRYEKKRKMI